jgi:soluble lytic murein transglycosylase-like protein
MQSSICIPFLLFLSASATADIYAYVDDSGTTHFSNVPTDTRYGVVLEDDTQQASEPVVIHPALLELSIRFDPLIQEAAAGSDLDPDLLRAVIVVESAFDPNAVSRAGAQGLMQLMPQTAANYGVSDVFDPRQNIQAGARYLRDLMNRYDDDYELVLAAYNAGEEAVAKYGNTIPPFSETRRYVPKVIGVYNRLQQIGKSG